MYISTKYWIEEECGSKEPPPFVRRIWTLKTEGILHGIAQTEDIWLKSALEGKRGVLLSTGRSFQKMSLKSFHHA